LPNVPMVELIPYHAIAEGKYVGLGWEYELVEILPPTQEQMQIDIALLAGYGLHVK